MSKRAREGGEERKGETERRDGGTKPLGAVSQLSSSLQDMLLTRIRKGEYDFPEKVCMEHVYPLC